MGSNIHRSVLFSYFDRKYIAYMFYVQSKMFPLVLVASAVSYVLISCDTQEMIYSSFQH